jgi:hypothetical protein
METNPPNVPALLNLDQSTPTLDKIDGNDSRTDAPYLHPFGHPLFKNKSLMQYCHNPPLEDAIVVEVRYQEGVSSANDPTGIESLLQNASLDGCK